MRTELKIMTMKEQIQKVKMIDLKSVIEHFRASFVHIPWQQIRLLPTTCTFHFQVDGLSF